jgi:BirA family biotin operon repressor/biotin-[acetyl-CoA-carboxylase] ligase
VCDLADEKQIDVRLYDGSIARLECHSALFSVSELARQYAKAGYPDRYCILAESVPFTTQNGKAMEYQDGIFLSIILRPNLFSSQASLIAPMTAVALATALDEHTTARCGIGWLSDVFSDSEKIGGCTVEGRLNSYSSFEYLIINISVRLNEKSFPTRMSDLIKKVFVEGNASLNQIIAKTIIQKFFLVFRDLKEPKKHIEKYMEKFILRGKKIKVIDGGKRHTCRVVDVNPETCALIVEDRSGRRLSVSSPSMTVIPDIIK